MKLIDTHCHLDFPEFDTDRNDVLKSCRAQGIDRILVPAVSRNNWQRVIDLCKTESGLFPAIGMHPLFLAEHTEDDLQALETLLAKETVIAIGEIGLDFYLPDLDPKQQQALFERQLEIAAHLQLPVLLHVRKAHEQVLRTLKRIQVPGGIAHAFNGSLEQARQYLALGFNTPMLNEYIVWPKSYHCKLLCWKPMPPIWPWRPTKGNAIVRYISVTALPL